MTASFLFIVVIIIAALIFDFINGFHDAANSIATIVSTRVLKPQWAVLWAAFFNFIAFLFFKVKVAATIGTGLVDPTIIDPQVIFAALIGAMSWNIFTWYYGLPSSSSHALIGGLIGAGVAKAGTQHLVFPGIKKVVVSIVASPLLGYMLAVVLMAVVVRIVFRKNRNRVNAVFRKLQFISAALFSLGHGSNDAQKTMGIITVLLYSGHYLSGDFHVPMWVIIVCNLFMALGTLFGGWRIVKTMGMKITKLTPVHGFCAETTASATLFLATDLGIPVSTTHTITGAIFGVGSLEQTSTMRWGIAGRIVGAWVITLPISATIAALLWYLQQVLNKIW